MARLLAMQIGRVLHCVTTDLVGAESVPYSGRQIDAIERKSDTHALKKVTLRLQPPKARIIERTEGLEMLTRCAGLLALFQGVEPIIAGAVRSITGQSRCTPMVIGKSSAGELFHPWTPSVFSAFVQLASLFVGLPPSSIFLLSAATFNCLFLLNSSSKGEDSGCQRRVNFIWNKKVKRSLIRYIGENGDFISCPNQVNHLQVIFVDSLK